MVAGSHGPGAGELTPRDPSLEDVAELCRALNVVRLVDGIQIPLAGPELLWRMKRGSHREQDLADVRFLKHWFEAARRTPPA